MVMAKLALFLQVVSYISSSARFCGGHSAVEDTSMGS